MLPSVLATTLVRVEGNQGAVTLDLSSLVELVVGSESPGVLDVSRNVGTVTGSLGAGGTAVLGLTVASNAFESTDLLAGVFSVRNQLWVVDNSGLQTLALDLSMIGPCASVIVSNNPQLQSLALTTATFDGSVEISGNGCLPAEAAQQVLSELLDAAPEPGVCPCGSCIELGNGSSCN